MVPGQIWHAKVAVHREIRVVAVAKGRVAYIQLDSRRTSTRSTYKPTLLKHFWGYYALGSAPAREREPELVPVPDSPPAPEYRVTAVDVCAMPLDTGQCGPVGLAADLWIKKGTQVLACEACPDRWALTVLLAGRRRKVVSFRNPFAARTDPRSGG